MPQPGTGSAAPLSNKSSKSAPANQHPTQDLHYLLELGVPVENIAARIGRTTTAIHHHLKQEQQDMEDAA